MNITSILKVSLWIWLIAFMILALLLTSCNPYAGLTTPLPTVSATPVSTETPGTPITVSTETPAPRVCLVATGVPAGNLNIRTGAGVTFAVITTLSEGQQLMIIDRAPRDGWIQVTTADRVTSWINGQYCAVQDGQQ